MVSIATQSKVYYTASSSIPIVSSFSVSIDFNYISYTKQMKLSFYQNYARSCPQEFCLCQGCLGNSTYFNTLKSNTDIPTCPVVFRHSPIVSSKLK